MNGYKSDVVILSGTLRKSLIIFRNMNAVPFDAFYVDMTLLTFNLLSGLDAGDRIALFTRFEGAGETPCQYDKEDHRFVLKGNET